LLLNKKSFELLKEELKGYGLSPKECLFIDDNSEAVNNAKEKGFNVVHYKDFPEVEKIQKELHDIGLGDSKKNIV